jgi:integrase
MASIAIPQRRKRRRRRTWGAVEERSGRYRASYPAPDGERYWIQDATGRVLWFTTYGDADTALAGVQADISRGAWEAPGVAEAKAKAAALTLRQYAGEWIANRRHPRTGEPLKARTREEYDSEMRTHVYPVFGDVLLKEIKPADVRRWQARARVGETARAHSYSLLKTILQTAVDDDMLPSNPCRVKGASKAPAGEEKQPLTPAELAALAEAMPERFRVLVLLGGWCSLRAGELSGLQRQDLDIEAGLLHIRRGVVRVRAGLKAETPKSKTSARTIVVPPHILPTLAEHLNRFTGPARDAWVFPGAGGGPLAHSTLQNALIPAAERIGRPDVRAHHLRHTGQTLSMLAGVSREELMARAGHISLPVTLRYLHTSEERQREIAERLSALA